MARFPVPIERTSYTEFIKSLTQRKRGNEQRCLLIFAGAQQWMEMSGEAPTLSPISARAYSKAGLPWFDCCDGDRKAIEGARALGKIKTVKTLSQRLRTGIWPEEAPLPDAPVKTIGAPKIKDGSW